MQWMTPRNAPEWVATSADGYYRVAPQSGDVPYRAYYVEAVWARPKYIGDGATIAEAQRVCETHARVAA